MLERRSYPGRDIKLYVGTSYHGSDTGDWHTVSWHVGPGLDNREAGPWAIQEFWKANKDDKVVFVGVYSYGEDYEGEP